MSQESGVQESPSQESGVQEFRSSGVTESGVRSQESGEREERIKKEVSLLFPVPYSLFPVPCSLFPVSCSLFPVSCFQVRSKVFLVT
ncbi:hypothetical protein [Dolichospermum sp. UHCC 0315A]|uniref:hypothetical protein n=1 Tax=Dolichospermum sp. UHCC 0315A TaxID=1914871 RepID=UPI001AEFCDA2|nr:hypothetical protein [Dolichospermum sp. UHCC 0315A]